ncbi:spermatogenesis-associated serine-rich protein 2-like isoform X2 [Scleropages formosus]|uniref:spermatogenesis-associated serine-rich protein 2-like isoform X2 n=1 Tax=Scleropages formosus TaxID=113540 RepID=UPI000878A7C5|nr:spermatogenesis-associated serine-rich protein 2-like isoform X2 [Scleropages formosus]
MARRSCPKDPTGVVFDMHSKMVMSQGGTFEGMKEKINAVRAIVPNRSNNEIILVLQHFENSVDNAVQAFVEGSATEILKEWNVTGKKKPKKKKKSKSQQNNQTDPVQAQSTSLPDGKDAVNGLHGNGTAPDGDSADSLSEQLDSASQDASEQDSEAALPEVPEAAPGTKMDLKPNNPSPPSSRWQAGRSRKGPARAPKGSKGRVPLDCTSQQEPALSLSVPGEAHPVGAGNKKIAPNIDKSVKDLYRCTASLTRYRVVVKEEMDSSIKKIKHTFAELQSCLIDREVALLAEMDKVKAEAMAILDTRQKKAESLRRLSDQSPAMTEDKLSELRADIKHFVSERKYDEELGKAVKFTHDLEPLRKSIMSFGHVYHPQTSYSNRSRYSSSSSVAHSAMVRRQPLDSGCGLRDEVSTKSQPQRPLGGHRHHSGPQVDHNLSCTGHRYQNQNNRGPAPGPDSASHASSLPSTSGNGLSRSTALSSRCSNPTLNGLPQRPPRVHRP